MPERRSSVPRAKRGASGAPRLSPTSRRSEGPPTCAKTRRRSSSRLRGRLIAPAAARSHRRVSDAAAASALSGLEREAHADRVVAAIDVERLAGDAGGEIRAQEGGSIADVLERDVATERCDLG